MAAAFRGKLHGSSSEDSGSDSDEAPWRKQAKRQDKVDRDEMFVNPLLNKVPKNPVWSNVLTDQTVTGDLGSFDIVDDAESTLVSRDVESYRVKDSVVEQLYGAKPRKYEDLDEMDSEEEEESEKDDFLAQLESYKKDRVKLSKRKKRFDLGDQLKSDGNLDLREKLKKDNNMKRKHTDLRKKLQMKQEVKTEAVYTSSAQFQSHIPRASVTDTTDTVLECITATLQEQNLDLFRDIVRKLGNEKALDILNKTADVENAGGMLIKTGSRRRTPGGVYIQLVRSDPSVSKDTISELFPPVDFSEMRSRKKKDARRRKRVQMARTRDGVEVEPLMDVECADICEPKVEPESIEIKQKVKVKIEPLCVDSEMNQDVVKLEPDSVVKSEPASDGTEDGEIMSD